MSFDEPQEASLRESTVTTSAQLLAVEHLAFRYRKGVEPVLTDFNLSLSDGASVGIVGRNGAGKTTALAATLSSLDGIYGGRVVVNGSEDFDIREFGLAGQEPCLYRLLTVQENILHVASLTLGAAEAKAATLRTLQEFELESIADVPTRHCSSGQRRLAHLAAAFVYDPVIRFLDEPTVALDIETRNRLVELILLWRSRGVSVVVTAHYPEDLEEMCDNLILLRDARSRDLGSTQGLLQAESATLLLKFADPCARSVIRVQPEGKRLELLVEEINDATLRECRINRIDIERESLRSILLAENSTALVETGSESPTPDLQQKLDGRRTTCSGGRVLAAVTRSEWTILKRLRSPFIFMFGLPLALALVLGPAVSASRGPGASGRSLIDFAVLFSFFSVNLVGGSLYRETWQETWRRQALFGPPKPAFLFGKMAPVCALGLVEMLILAALGVTVFHLPVGNRFPLIIPVAVCLVLCGGSIGAFLYTVTRSSITFSNMSYLFLLIFGAAGGSIVVSNRLPSAIHEFGYATPQYWGISSVVSLTTGHLSWRGYFEGLLIVLSLAILFFALAVWLLDYRTERINA